ncbi:MAG: ferric reductase-like transmembrane domain-containing protein [Gammaproteobacteria bacterium]|nr:ferric reductase-like transmembrane domain-containing protein [Gammaproteobacteria bacterium]
MSVAYRAVQWNRQKMIYDGLLASGVVVYVWGYISLASLLDTNADAMNIRIRAFGSAAFILLHIILSIGPLCRLDRRFLPLLYNRRHMGVTMCLLALYHAYLVLGWYHDFGNLEPIISLFASNTQYGSLFGFPFEMLGLGALVILIFMAATSHDFWLANLTAPVWKALHMGVYLAYALLIAHVLLGALQSNTGTGLNGMVVVGALWIVFIHLLAGWRERDLDRPVVEATDGLVPVGLVTDIPENRAKIVCAAGERIAVFRYDGKISAISNVCQHQNGPLGEGHVIDGLVTCPWHGYQYDPACGASPPPFSEKVPTFEVVIRNGQVFVDPKPHPAGTRIEPAKIEEKQ